MTAEPEATTTRRDLPWWVWLLFALGLIGVAFVLYLVVGRDSAGEDFTAVSPAALVAQQQCFDASLFYDAYGNCYEVDPASLKEEARPGFVVLATSVPAPSEEPSEVGSETLAGGTTQTNPSGGGSSSGTGQSNPGGGGTSTTGQSNPGGGTSSGTTGGSGSTSTGSSSTSSGSGSTSTGSGSTSTGSGSTTTGTTDTTDTTDTTTDTTDTTTTTDTGPKPIVATSSDEWVFKMSPTPPEGSCERVDGVKPIECQNYDGAYSGSSSFQCDHASSGGFSCPKQNDANRDQTITGDITRSGVSLTRKTPGQSKAAVYAMSGSGSNVKDGSNEGEICTASGSYTETRPASGSNPERVVKGTWSARRNAQGC